MRIYIAGQVSGLDMRLAADIFRKGERILDGLGHEPLNPLTLFPVNADWTWEDYMIADLRIVLEQAEALYMLPNWRHSKGARIEHSIAEILGKPIYYAPSEIPEAG